MFVGSKLNVYCNEGRACYGSNSCFLHTVVPDVGSKDVALCQGVGDEQMGILVATVIECVHPG